MISDLAVILIAAGVVTVLFKWLKQPVVLGYIVAGILAGPAVPFLPTVADTANIKIWADIGVIFLLFAMGLEFSFRKLMSVGSTAVVAAVVIVSGMMFLGYTAGNLMGFSHITSIFLGGMLSMSSTAVVFKSFDDLGLREQKFAGVVLGGLGWYQPLIEFAGAGATVPLTGFGALLAKGVRKAVTELGLTGIFSGGLTAAAAGVTAAVVFGLIVAVIFKPKSK